MKSGQIGFFGSLAIIVATIFIAILFLRRNVPQNRDYSNFSFNHWQRLFGRLPFRLMVVVIALPFIIGSLLLGRGMSDLATLAKSNSWSTTTGTIRFSQLEERSIIGISTYKLVLKYDYHRVPDDKMANLYSQLAGMTGNSQQITIHDFPSFNRPAAEHLGEMYSKGTAVTVYYDAVAEYGQIAVLQRELTWGSFVLSGVGMGFNLLGGMISYAFLKVVRIKRMRIDMAIFQKDHRNQLFGE